MNAIYILGAAVILMLFYYNYKSGSLNKEQIISETPKEINLDIADQIIAETANHIKPEIATKNKWLYPTDEYGKMEKGVVYDSTNYASKLIEISDGKELIIFTKKKCKNKSKKCRRE